MKLGIIIPTYDNLSDLKLLIKQIFKYTKCNYKVIVVEDGQKPETVKWLKTQQKIKKVFHKTNKGVSVSWNDGIQAAEKLNCTHFAIFNDDIELPRDWWSKCDFKDSHLVFLDKPCPIEFTGWFFIFDKYCLEQVGYFDTQFEGFTSEDADWWFRFRNKRLRYLKIDLDVIHHESTTIKKIPREKFIKTWNENWTKLRKKYPTIRLTDNLKHGYYN